MKIKLENIRELAKSLLFENNINELRLSLEDDLDAGKNNRTSAKDQKGPMIDGEGNYKNSWEEIDELPLTPSEVMPIFYDEKVSQEYVEDEEYIPDNTLEFIKASNTLFYNHKDELESKHIKAAWKTLKKIVDRVK